MGEYVNGQKARENGSSTQNVNITQQNIDVAAIAKAVAEALGKQTGYRAVNSKGEVIDDFDNQASLEKLANAMVIRKQDNETNFDKLGTVKQTRKDDKEVQDTIDLLSDLKE